MYKTFMNKINLKVLPVILLRETHKSCFFFLFCRLYVLLEESHILTSYVNRNLCKCDKSPDSASSISDFLGYLPCQRGVSREKRFKTAWVLISAHACYPTYTETNYE